MPIKRAKLLYKYYTEHTKPILYVILAILFVLVLYLWRKPPKVVSTASKDNIVLRQAEIIEDRNDHKWAIIKQQTLDIQAAKKREDSLAYALRIKPKFIKGRDVYVSKSDTIFTSETIVKVDTITKDTTYIVYKKDAWIDITATVGKINSDIQYKSFDTINRVVIRKNPIFGRPTTEIRLNNSNPYNQIQKGYSYVVKERVPWLTIGPSVQYTPFNPKKVTVGISAQIPIIKLKR